LEIKQEEWPKKRVWHKWGGMLLSHSGHWKVVRSPSCTKKSLLPSPPSLRLRPKAAKRKSAGRRLLPLPFALQNPQEESKEESVPEEERVTTPFGNGHLISLERDGIMKIQLKFGIAYIHQSKLALPPKARIGPEGLWEEEKTSPKWTVALIDRSRYLDGEQHLMYVFTRKPVGLVFYPQTLSISETRMDANAAGITRGDRLLEIDGKPVGVDTFPAVYKRTIVPFSMKFHRPKPTSCEGCTCSRGTPCTIS